MGLVLRNLSGYQRGIELDEVGINIERLEVRIAPEWKEKLADRNNQTRGFAHPDAPSREITITGEIKGTTGIMAMVYGTTLVILNDIDYFGSSAGDLYGDEATIVQGRAEWKNLSLKLSSDPLCSGSS